MPLLVKLSDQSRRYSGVRHKGTSHMLNLSDQIKYVLYLFTGDGDDDQHWNDEAEHHGGVEFAYVYMEKGENQRPYKAAEEKAMAQQ